MLEQVYKSVRQIRGTDNVRSIILVTLEHSQIKYDLLWGTARQNPVPDPIVVQHLNNPDKWIPLYTIIQILGPGAVEVKKLQSMEKATIVIPAEMYLVEWLI